MSEFYNEIIEKLKQESKYLNCKLEVCRKENDMNKYISTLKSLRETLDLISRYDWRFMFSEYIVTKEDSDEEIMEVAIWQQNHDGQIRNHKVWKTNIPVKSKDNGLSIKYNK